MEKIKLNNGMSVVYAGHAKSFSGVLSINIGHVNEPSLGIANLFERTLLLQTRGIIPVFGGTMTAYTTGGSDLEEVFTKLHQVFNQTVVNDKYVEEAKQLIRQQTEDTAPMTMRRMKLSYKHTAYGDKLVKTTEEYLDTLASYTTEDVRTFANTYYTGNNIVLVVSGPKVAKKELKKLAEQFFGSIDAGTPCPKAPTNIYTGGFDKIEVKDNTSRVMFGWDMSHLNVDDSPYINVMMSMFLRRMERAFADLGYTDVQVDLKIAGYYGLRTIRAYLASPTLSAKDLTSIFIKALNRICDTRASDRRLERSRNSAMTEKLDKYERSGDRALETAWQMIGRGQMYDVNVRINLIYETTADDVMDMAIRIFRGSRPTYIVAAPEGSNAYYSFDEFVKRIGWKA